MPNLLQYKKTILWVLVLALLVVGYVEISSDSFGAKIAFLDVGQGDAILISLPGDKQIIIDGGPSNDILPALARHMPFYDKEIELLVLTHPHADHLRGLNHIFRHYSVKNVLFSGVSYESSVYREFIELLKKEGSNIYIGKQGNKISWQDVLSLEILSPSENILGKEFREIHDSTVIIHLSFAGLDFLLMGDADSGMEGEVLKRGLVGDIDVLKVGHHGSKTSTSQEFLNTTLPEVAVISVGKNSYGHPHPSVIQRLQALGSKILRTDKEGDIVWQFRIQN